MEYITKREMTTLKSRLTRAKRSGDPHKIIAVCDDAFALFNEKSYPDNWHLFNIARQDAEYAIMRGDTLGGI